MRLHGPSPPQGDNNRSLLFSLLPPHIQYSPPHQGGIIPPPIDPASSALVQTDSLSALVQTGTLEALVTHPEVSVLVQTGTSEALVNTNTLSGLRKDAF